MAPAQRVGLQAAGRGHWLVGEGERKAELSRGDHPLWMQGAKQRGRGTMPGEEGAQRCCHCSWQSWKGAGRRGAEHRDGTHQRPQRRLGWTGEQSSNHLLRQIKGKRGGLPLMF